MYRCASPKCNRRFCEECAVFELDEICPFPSEKKKNKDHNLVEDNETPELFGELWCELPDFCTFETYGCQEVLMRDAMKKHERECLYRNINCPDIDCDAIVHFMNLQEHFDREHSECLEYDGSGGIHHEIAIGKKLVRSGFYWPPPRIWCFDDKQFFLVTTVEDKILYSWVYFFGVNGDKKEAKKILYNLSIRSPSTGEEHYFTGRVRHLEEDPKEIMFQQNAFAIGTHAVQRFLNKNYELVFNLKICKAD